MEGNEKKGKFIIIAVVVFIVVVLAIGIITSVNRNKEEVKQEEDIIEIKEDGTVENKSSKVKEDREIKGFKVTNIDLIKDTNGNTILTADVTNETGKNQKGFLVEIILLDKEGKELGRIPGAIIETEAGETIELRSEITEDYINAYDIKLIER